MHRKIEETFHAAVDDDRDGHLRLAISVSETKLEQKGVAVTFNFVTNMFSRSGDSYGEWDELCRKFYFPFIGDPKALATFLREAADQLEKAHNDQA